MIELIVIDIAALLQTNSSVRMIMLHQLDKDGVEIACWGEIPADNMKWGLKQSCLFEYFDLLLHRKAIKRLSSKVLRRLADPSTLWIRHPSQCNYSYVASHLNPPKRRMSPWIALSNLA